MNTRSPSAHTAFLLCVLLFALLLAIPAAVAASWTNSFNRPGDGTDIARSMAVDSSGNVIVTGLSYTTNYAEFVTVKYSNSGGPLWTNYYKDVAGGVSEGCAGALAPHDQSARGRTDATQLEKGASARPEKSRLNLPRRRRNFPFCHNLSARTIGPGTTAYGKRSSRGKRAERVQPDCGAGRGTGKCVVTEAEKPAQRSRFFAERRLAAG